MNRSTDSQSNSGGQCPICHEPVSTDSDHAPFCSKRCKQIDLGKWLGGDYAITRSVEERDLDEG